MDIMYYIDYKVEHEGNAFKRFFSRLCYCVEIAQLDGCKRAITINRPVINRRFYNKIDKKVYEMDRQHLKSNVIVSNLICCKENLPIEWKPKEKYTMKALLPELVQIIEKITGANFKLEDVYVAINSEKSMEALTYIAQSFRSVNIVTTKVNKIEEHEIRLDSGSFNYSISNNRRKSLKKAKLFINFDFTNELLNGFQINRNCIVVNLNQCTCCFKSSFHGTVIESIDISYNNKYTKNMNANHFNSVKLYDSFICGDKCSIARAQCINDMCKIKGLLGPINPVNEKEIQNNYTKNRINLDKL